MPDVLRLEVREFTDLTRWRQVLTDGTGTFLADAIGSTLVERRPPIVQVILRTVGDLAHLLDTARERVTLVAQARALAETPLGVRYKK